MFRILCTTLVALATTLAVSPVAAQIYRWVDAEGKVHFSNIAAPRGAERVETRAAPTPAPAASASTGSQTLAQAKGPAARPQVIMYATSWCPYCAKARALFRAQGVAFTEHDIEKSPAAHAEFKRLGGRGVPVIVIGNQTLKGFNEAKIKSALAATR